MSFLLDETCQQKGVSQDSTISKFSDLAMTGIEKIRVYCAKLFSTRYNLFESKFMLAMCNRHVLGLA